MVKVAGIWEMGWNIPLVEQHQWDYALAEYDVDEWIMTPISGIDGPCVEYASIQEAINANKDLTIVYVNEHGKQEVGDFRHPRDALYVFGRSSESTIDYDELTVRIDTVNNNGRLWAHQAACIILDHRYRNGNNSNRSTSNSK